MLSWGGISYKAGYEKAAERYLDQESQYNKIANFSFNYSTCLLSMCLDE